MGQYATPIRVMVPEFRPAMSVRLRKSAGELGSPDGDGPQATEYSVEIEPYNRRVWFTNA
jgi:hypothetical protein